MREEDEPTKKKRKIVTHVIRPTLGAQFRAADLSNITQVISCGLSFAFTMSVIRRKIYLVIFTQRCVKKIPKPFLHPILISCMHVLRKYVTPKKIIMDGKYQIYVCTIIVWFLKFIFYINLAKNSCFIVRTLRRKKIS